MCTALPAHSCRAPFSTLNMFADSRWPSAKASLTYEVGISNAGQRHAPTAESQSSSPSLSVKTISFSLIDDAPKNQPNKNAPAYISRGVALVGYGVVNLGFFDIW